MATIDVLYVKKMPILAVFRCKTCIIKSKNNNELRDGHTNVKTTQIYAHIVDKSKRNAADVIHIENLTPTNDDIESVPAI